MITPVKSKSWGHWSGSEDTAPRTEDKVFMQSDLK
jgi:hypothetical protein